jgi:acetylornithine/succinyldiaminopimelate/putrescine aminotransferase
MNIDESTYFDETRLSRPKLERLLKALLLDKHYHRALGNKMWYKNDEGDEMEVSDFIGGYGSALLGHHHPTLNAFAIDLLTSHTPIHSQMSSKKEVHELAAFLQGE